MVNKKSPVNHKEKKIEDLDKKNKEEKEKQNKDKENKKNDKKDNPEINKENKKENNSQTKTKGDSIDNKDAAIDVTLEADEPQGFNTKLDEIKDKSKYISRTKEKGFVNEEYGSSVALRENGQISLASGKQGQFKINASGVVDTIGLEVNTTSNRVNFKTDDFVINNHKMNPNLYEFTGFKTVPLQDNHFATVGNFTMAGYVLVRAWDRQLNRYMLIRRPARIAPFGPKLNIPDINSALKVDDPLKLKEDILALSKKGYQVNAKIEDKKSYIGKKGEKRDDAKYGAYGGDKDGRGSGGRGNINPSTRKVRVKNSDFGDQLYAAATATAKKSGITLDFILAHFVVESGWDNDPNGNYNYGNIRWDPRQGVLSSGFGFHQTPEECAEAYVNHTVAFDKHGQELVNASNNNDPETFYKLLKDGGYFTGEDDSGGVYGTNFGRALKTITGT